MPTLTIVRNQNQNSDDIRRRALERLYERKAAVDDLIRSLEGYQRAKRKPQCIPFSAERKCS